MSESAGSTRRGGRPSFEALEPRLLLSTYTVTTLADAGAGSLRQAILDANTNAGADEIDFQPGLTGTIPLTSGQLSITDDLTVAGPGATQLTIDAAFSSRVLYVGPSVTDASLSGLTITGGGFLDAGGIYNAGTLTITHATISGNLAVYGGGMHNVGTVTVSKSTIAGNRANSAHGSGGHGGGIYNDGSLTITNSTISGNSAEDRGGGIYNDEAALTIVNSTVTDNRADSDDSGSGDGGGIRVLSGTVTLHNTIMAGNFKGSASTPDDVNGAITANYCLVQDTGGTTFEPGSGDNITGQDPLLAPLDYYYFAAPTKTHALLPASPAIDAGSDALALDPQGQPLTTDQRGYDRFVDGDADLTATVDIGAYEYEAWPGDWHGNGLVEAGDIDELFANLGDPGYDLDGDGVADSDDVDYLIHEVLGTEYGDSNLDGAVDGADYTAWADNYGQPGGWGSGDVNGDGIVDGADYTGWADHYGFSAGGAAGQGGAASAGRDAGAKPMTGVAGRSTEGLGVRRAVLANEGASSGRLGRAARRRGVLVDDLRPLSVLDLRVLSRVV